MTQRTPQPRRTRSRRRFAAALSLLLLAQVSLEGCQHGDDLPSEQDALAVMRLVRDSSKVAAELEKRPEFWARSATEPLTTDERAWLLPLFATFIDEDLAFDSYASRFLRKQGWRTNKRELAMVRAMGLASFAKQLRERVRLLRLVGENTAIFKALDEGSPEHGVAAGQLTRIAIETARPDTPLELDIGIDALRDSSRELPSEGLAPSELNHAWQALAARRRARATGATVAPKVLAAAAKLEIDPLLTTITTRALTVAQDARKAYRKIAGKLLRHMLGVMIGNELDGVLDPIVADIALWMGDARLRDNGRHLISEAQLDELLPELQPGDVILERRNWYLSNLGLPGFWPHAALFVGSPSELAKWADDAEVRKLFPDGLLAHLKKTSPEAYAAYEAEHEGKPSRVIESVSEGVIFSSLHHSCLADYVGILRPRRSKAERAWAIAAAFTHFGKPYDFDFDFQTVSALVCSELVYTAYDLPAKVGKGLDFSPLPEVFGIVTLPPNEIIARFDREFDQPDRTFDFVAFLDGDETKKAARRGTADDLRKSWLRPKWDLNQ